MTVVAATAQTPSALLAPSEPNLAEKADKVLRAYRLTGETPVVDGQLDDEAWVRAESVTSFVQIEPDNMEAASERTVVQIAYDDRYLYVAARCYTKDPSLIIPGRGRRDNLPTGDQFSISLDPQHDHLTAYVFQANASGSLGDLAWFDDTQANGDYDAVWSAETVITLEGWDAEFRIPFSQMRFTVPASGPVVWGLNLRRDIPRRGEYDRWVGTPRGAQGFVSRFGHLIFDTPMAPPRRSELVPFALARLQDEPRSRTGDVTGGLDLRLGIGTASTFAATVNPDFGQVEQDPAVLNLTVYETFFPEKRPFFLQDSRVFVPQFTEFKLFHSRRIGSAPDSTILAAGKLTGKRGPWTYGGLSAATERDSRNPRSSYHVARIQRDVLHGSSNIGAILTGVERTAAPGAVTGGIDYALRWKQNAFQWNGTLAFTRATVTRAAPGANQSGDARTGFGGLTNVSLSKKHVYFNTHLERYDRDFHVSDLGFFGNRNNKTEANVNLTLLQPDPWFIFRIFSPNVAVHGEWNGDGLLLDNWLQVGLNADFRNFSKAYIWAGRSASRYDDLDTRGGPPIATPGRTYWGLFTSTDSRKLWNISFDLNVGHSDAGGWDYQWKPSFSFQPTTRLQASFGASYLTLLNVAQWIENRDADADGTVDHIYGRLRQHVVDVTARATYTLQRDLSLQVFLQPFVAVGAYGDVQRLARPRSFDFEPVAATTSPDFNTKSVRSNVILRWEYTPGSTLFFVWNMSALDTSRPGVFAPFRDLGSAFEARGTNVLMVKASYWLGL